MQARLIWCIGVLQRPKHEHNGRLRRYRSSRASRMVFQGPSNWDSVRNRTLEEASIGLES